MIRSAERLVLIYHGGWDREKGRKGVIKGEKDRTREVSAKGEVSAREREKDE